MEALLDLREGLGTHLADKRERSKRKDRPICDEIRAPSEILWQGNGRHIREMAAAASWHPRRRKADGSNNIDGSTAFYEETLRRGNASEPKASEAWHRFVRCLIVASLTPSVAC